MAAENKVNEVKHRKQHGWEGGPMGLGDPDDRSLRKVEKEVLIPQKMRERAHKEKCVPEVEEFNKCCQATGVLMIAKCRKETSVMRECLTKWYFNEDFKRECTEEYIRERSEYRRTGVPVRRYKRK